MSRMLFRSDAGERIGTTSLTIAFDAEVSTPDVIENIAEKVPQIRDVMASLRNAVPLVPHSGVGPLGRSGFYRLPNHYRSVSYVLPPTDPCNPDSSPGVIVFKGTEPLLPDFPDYVDWMLKAPFRSSVLPLALHFPLDMKLPPAAMWIRECLAEQAVSSKVQQLYLQRYSRLARLPLPLYVFKMTREHVSRYEAVLRSRISEDAMSKCRSKIEDGLGIEVYFYPELPVRVADLFVGNVREMFAEAITPEQVSVVYSEWMKLFADILCLDFMPYAPWHHGMGGCCDIGNVCIDGGFQDLLTLVSFDTIPNDTLFRQCMSASIRMLAESMSAMAAASIGMSSAVESDAGHVATAMIIERIRERIYSHERSGHCINARLKRSLDTPHPGDVIQVLRDVQQNKSVSAQYVRVLTPNVLPNTTARGAGVHVA
jgi:hypothetical protein